MRIDRAHRRIAFVSATTLLAAALTSSALAGESTPRRALTATLRERVVHRADFVEVRGRSVLRLTARTGVEDPATSLELSLGDLELTVPLDRGRHRGKLAGMDLHVTVRARSGRLRVVVRAPRGAVFGDRALTEADRVGGPVYALEAAGFALDDGPPTFFAVAAHGRIDAVVGAGGKSSVRARIRGDAMLPGDPGGAPRARLIPDRRRSSWRGRVRGHGLVQGESPLVNWRLDRGPDVFVDALDAEAPDIGEVRGEFAQRRVRDGVVSLDFDAGTVTQTRFDFAVSAREGVHDLIVGVWDETGRGKRIRRSFSVDAPRPPALLDAGLHVLESRDGALWAWGENGSGEVGDGTRRTPLSPVPLKSPSGVIALAAGGDFSLAVDGDGAVWQWGEWERTREIVPGVFETAFIGSKVPVRENDLSGIVAVAGGEDHALALDDRGRVFAWGENSAGQLGDGSTKSRARGKQRVAGLPEVVAIAATDEGSVALDRDGVVWAWGDTNLDGVADPSIPEAVLGMPRIRAIDGRGIVLCLAQDGSVWTWGENSDGELGDGTTLDRPFPGLVLGLRDIVQVSAGDFHSLALRDDGRILAWGDNVCGELGDGTSVERRVPVLVRDVQDATLIAAGTFASFAVTSDGAVWAWGVDALEEGPIGDGGLYPSLATRAFEPGHLLPDKSGGFFQFKR